MKIDRYNLPKLISIFLSLLTYFIISLAGAKVLPTIVGLLRGLFILLIASLFLVLFFPQLKKYLSFPSISDAFLIYIGFLFLSLSRFKKEVSDASVDLNAVGIGLAMIGLALGSTVQRQEQKPQAEASQNPSPPGAADGGNASEVKSKDQELPSLDVVLDEVRRTLDSQFEQLDGLSTKSGIILGVASVVFTLLVTKLMGQPETEANSILAKIALVPIFACMALSFLAIVVIPWDRPPNLQRLRSHYLVEDENKTKLSIIDICIQAIDKNEKRLKPIIRLVKCSYYLLIVGLFLLAVWIGMAIW